jgi:hypothetical protein
VPVEGAEEKELPAQLVLLAMGFLGEGRSAAAGVDAYLTGRTVLPRPINPTDRPLL